MKMLNKKCLFLFAVFIILPAVILPSFALAQTVGIPCDGAINECDFDDLLQLGTNILKFLVLISIPLATIAFAWSGTLMLTARGNESQIEKAKGIFASVLIGFLFVLSAWLIVRLITSALLNENNYTDLLDRRGSVLSRPLASAGELYPSEFDTILG